MMHNLGIKTIIVTTNEFDDLVKGSKVQKNWIEALKKLAIFKLYDLGTSHYGSVIMNPTNIHEGSGLIHSFTQ